MSDIGRWLDEHGLGKYAELFVENEIDFDVLEELTPDELERLGIPLGARKRLFKAISAWGKEAFVTPGTELSTTSGASYSTGAERRQLTVLFADLVGSVDYGQRMDVEDYRHLLSAVRDAVVWAIERFDGFVARHQGDGVLAYFGYPQAQENDAERSIRAGLAALQAVRDLEIPVVDIHPTLRVGIATGEAIVGDILATGASEHSELAALGPTPNLAARLQGHASPGTVVVSDTTERLTRGFFETTKLAQIELKGLDSPVTAFQAIRELSIESASAVLETASSLSPLVGREGELSLLMERWGHAKRGAGQCVLVSAEPGVGKSRLVREIRQRVGSDAEQIIVFYCSPYHTGSALHPVLEALSRSLTIEQELSATAKFERLKAWLTTLAVSSDKALEVFAELLSIRPEDAPALALSPEELRRETLAALLEVLQAMAALGPVLLISEDLHWVDPTSSELFGAIIEGIRDHRVLVIYTFRPEFRHDWRPQPHTTNLTLNHLTRDECRLLAEQVIGDVALPDHVISGIVSRADGVALFIEELSQAIIESPDSTSPKVPATLRDTLTARLDRLGAAKSVAQLASVIGRQFRGDWLRAASGQPDEEVQAGLEELRMAGLVFSRPGSAEEYEFKHALVRDTAYDSLLREERERMHASVAYALEGSAEVPAEVLATHFLHGTEPDRAIDLWLEAQASANARGALQESVQHAQQAMAEIERLGERSSRTIDAAMKLGLSLHHAGRRQEALGVLEQYQGLLDTNGTSHARAQYYSACSMVCGFLGRRAEARGHAQRAQQLAAELEDPALVARIAQRVIAESIFGGDLGEAINEAPALDAMAESGATGQMLAWSRVTVSWACWWAGDCHAAVRYADMGREDAGDDSTRAHGSWALGGAKAGLGEFVEAIELLEDTLTWADPFCCAIVHGAYSHAVFCSGDVARGVVLMEESLAGAEEYRSKQIQAWAALNLAYAYHLEGDVDKSESVAREWHRVATEIESRQLVGRADWVLGALRRDTGDLDEAWRHLSAARRQLEAAGAPGDVAGVAVDMARLHKVLGRDAEARADLQLASAVWSRYSNAFRLTELDRVAGNLGIELRG